MTLWFHWYQAIVLIRPAFSRQRSFLWFALCVMGMSVRNDNLGVTSIVRALALRPDCYHNLRENMHSQAIKLSKLSAVWVRCVFTVFSSRIIHVNERVVLLADGKRSAARKIAKSGKKMPGVKCLHQESENNSKAPFIMGHSAQALSLLVSA